MMAPHPSRLVEDLSEIARRRGIEAKTITLTSAATASLLLGTPDYYRPLLRRLARSLDITGKAATTWQAWVARYPYLDGHVDPIIGWLNDPPPGWSQVFADQIALLAEVDLAALAERPDAAGDHLGQMLAMLDVPADRVARGAFYTPASLAQLVARESGVKGCRPGDSIAEPCVGGGAMAVAAVRAMREAGRSPEAVRWNLGDIDRTALAVAGLAMSIHGIPDVSLRYGDALQAAS